ncbi:MAG TPA: holo-ACP synthase [Rectinemataceae bacterium]|nr:holo-ACP synthase [Rectinemataceae bacterium]
MILGIGVDVVHVRRIHHWLETPGLVDRFFHPDEITASLGRGHAAALSLAARFAAKEAFGKAVGTGLAGVKLRDIQVINNHNGRPDMILHGTALDRFNDVGGGRVHVSLTHESDNAIAMVVIEG